MTTTPPPDRFVSYERLCGVTGSRSWPQLSEAEQDQYLLACFEGEAQRAAAEARLELFDRAANSIAQHLLGVYQQYDTDEGVARYTPPTPRIAAGVLERRQRALEGTVLGQRLNAALARAEGKKADAPTAELKFYSVAPSAKGMDVIDEQCSGDTGWMVPHGFKRWNDFEALDRLHYQHTSAKWKASQGAEFERMLHDSRVQHEANQAAAPTAVIPAPSPASPEVTPRAPQPTRDSSWLVYVAVAVAGALLCGALVDSFAAWYYTLLRTAVCISLGWLAVRALGNDMTNWAVALGLAALLYNPLAPVHLGRDAWQPINVATLGLLVVFCVLLWRRERVSH